MEHSFGGQPDAREDIESRDHRPVREAQELARALALAEARVSALEQTLAEQVRDRADLVHLLGHELRTPIMVINGFGRLLESGAHGPLGERQAHFVEESLKACRRLDRFVADLLEACPVSGSPLALRCEDCDLEALVRSLLASLEPLLAERRIELEAELETSLPKWYVDPCRVEQVLSNLVMNAMRHAGDGARIRVRLDRNSEGGGEEQVELSVEDDGPGIDPVDRERVLQPYERAGGRREGLGLGLSICRRIVEAHGGHLRIDESPLGGARFVFDLPGRSAAGLES